jgi:hypothetical protein
MEVSNEDQDKINPSDCNFDGFYDRHSDDRDGWKKSPWP